MKFTVVAAVIAVACSRQNLEDVAAVQSEPGKQPGGSPTAQPGSDGHDIGTGALSDERSGDFEALLGRFGMRFATSEDRPLTTFVTKHLKQSGRNVPQEPRFVISRSSDHWVVSVIDLNDLRQQKRITASVTYHVSDRGGGFRVISIEPGI